MIGTKPVDWMMAAESIVSCAHDRAISIPADPAGRSPGSWCPACGAMQMLISGSNGHGDPHREWFRPTRLEPLSELLSSAFGQLSGLSGPAQSLFHRIQGSPRSATECVNDYGLQILFELAVKNLVDIEDGIVSVRDHGQSA